MKKKLTRTYLVDLRQEDEPRLQTEEHYNEHGNVTESTSFLTNGNVLSNNKYLYGSDQKLIKEEIYNSEGGTTTVDYSHNQEGEVIEVALKSGGSLVQIQKFIREGSKTIEITEDDEGNILDKRIDYIEDGLIKSNEHFENEELSAKQVFEHNSKGEISSKIVEDYFNDRTQRIEFKYDHKGRILEETQYIDDDISNVVKYTYEDPFKQIITQESGGTTFITTTVYDKNEKVVEEVLQDGDGTVFTKHIIERNQSGDPIKQSFLNYIGDPAFGESFIFEMEHEYF